MKEYVVTLHNYEDLQSFYDDMETPGGNLYIPDRAVSVSARRPLSRNTHYLLTDEEADAIRNDPRVLAVELSLDEIGVVIEPSWTESSTNWSKSGSVSNSMKNWGILRCVEGVQRSNWGSNGTSAAFGTVSVNASGKNVDVVIVDGHMNPAHPEFAVNVDGTGGSRVNQYNWFELRQQVEGLSSSTYVYAPYVDPTYPDTNGDGLPDRTVDNDHGCHVAGIVAGNTMGWAHDANIYNISPYATSPSSTGYFLDYVKAWHNNKLPNPDTGIKNPTIVNNSWGATAKISISSVTSVTYQGTTIAGPFNATQLQSYGIYCLSTTTFTSVRSTAFEQDLIDLAAAGAIVVASAGNTYSKVANYSASPADDYNNYYTANSVNWYYNRGSIGSSIGTICVGAIGALSNDSKADYSNCGPRVDVYAPGSNIMSSVNSTLGSYANDTRNTAFTNGKKSGTSMASPQITGLLACLLETWPRMQQSEALTYISNNSKLGQITAGTGGPTDFTDLQGSSNKFMFYLKERKDSGQVGPKQNQGNRPSSGMMYPRTKIFRYGR